MRSRRAPRSGKRSSRAADRSGRASAAPAMPELRKDPLLGRWVVLEPERVRRPADFRGTRSRRHEGPCVLCAGHERETPPGLLVYRDKPEDGGWRVRAAAIKFPALRAGGRPEGRGD